MNKNELFFTLQLYLELEFINFVQKRMAKKKIYILGLITLLLFPLPTFLILPHFGVSFYKIFQFDNLTILYTGLGIEFGIVYAFLALVILRSPVFDKIPDKIEVTLKEMQLTIPDCVFLSFCAGFGEELLFRSGIQHFLGVFPTTFLFIAIHGYFNPRSWRKSLYGVILLPFILLISIGFEHWGLWFAIGAHFSYDLVLFLALREGE